MKLLVVVGAFYKEKAPSLTAFVCLHLEDVLVEALLARVPAGVVVVAEFEDEVATVVGRDVHYHRDPGAGGVVPHDLS